MHHDPAGHDLRDPRLAGVEKVDGLTNQSSRGLVAGLDLDAPFPHLLDLPLEVCHPRRLAAKRDGRPGDHGALYSWTSYTVPSAPTVMPMPISV